MAQGRSLVLLALSGVFSYVAVLVFHWNSGVATPAYLAPSWFQASPKLAMQNATSVFLQSKGNIDTVDLEEINAALAQAPLEDEPFTFAAASQFNSENVQKTEELLKLALRRNPRSREARIYLLELLVDEGRVSESIEQIEVLSRLMPERRGFFQSNLLYLATLPETRSEAIASITDDGARRDLLWSLARAGASASMILDTYDAFDDFDIGNESEVVINRWIAPLIDREDYDGARRVWSRFNPETNADALLVDGAFSGKYGPPFGWTVRSGSQGYAKLGDYGLTGEYYGRRPTRLANQLLLLQPGVYAFTSRNLANVEPIHFAIRCINREELVGGPIDQPRPLTFEVPADGCAAQSLEITGQPTEPPRSVNFEIGSVELELLAS